MRLWICLTLLVFSACGKGEPPPTNLISGSFKVIDITCNGGDPGSSIKALYTSPAELDLQYFGATIRLTQTTSGCKIWSESPVTYALPGKTTAAKMIETTGGAYSCEPAACDSKCGTIVPTASIEYDFVADSTTLNLVAYDTDPLCANAGKQNPAFYTFTKEP